MSDFVHLWINCLDRFPVYWLFCEEDKVTKNAINAVFVSVNLIGSFK